MFPIHSLVLENRELGLVVAVMIGFAFGFVLERAGFGKATKLAAQFYLYDMTVFKVMFGAIITAMAGAMVADGVGLVDLRELSESAVSLTYLWPMLLGGLVLGAGFIISGYCPGTSIVGIASGHIDAVFAFVGVILGSVIYGEIFPLVSGFHSSGDRGFLFLYDLLRMPPAAVAAIVVAMALAMFIGAEKVERIFAARRDGGWKPSEQERRPRAMAFATIGSMAVLALGTLALPSIPEAGTAPRQAATISQKELARRLLDEPWTMRILDLRNREACAKARIPGSECAPLDTVSELGLEYASGAKDLVLVRWRTEPAPRAALEYPGDLLVLDGGWLGWRQYALTKPALPGPAASETERADYSFRAALNSAITGMKPAPPPPPASGVAVPQRKKKKGGGCS